MLDLYAVGFLLLLGVAVAVVLGLTYRCGKCHRSWAIRRTGDERHRSELAGATFSPDGSTLFFNIQTSGLTVAVTGPWDRARDL